MPTAPPADHGPNTEYHKDPGDQPLPGYRLLEPLGRGGYGEVWKCVAPGGLHKAIKFVVADGQGNGQFRQELEAFEQIKSIRHPFLLSLERVEVVGYELVMVMELADRQLADRFKECRAEGLPGIPRDELLGYFAEAAEALDLIGTRYGLQHLDVKPANLFLTCGHVKVGDYGLVSRLDGQVEADPSRGLTPKYVAPEVLLGRVHTRSDQYSLALVYFELLTGEFPYTCRTAQQLLMQHTAAAPNLSPLPESDREAVGVALRKNPEERFPSCREFVRALREKGDPSSAVLGNTPRPVGAVETAFARPSPSPAQTALGETTERQPRMAKPPQAPAVAPGGFEPEPEPDPPFAESVDETCPNLVRPAGQGKPDQGSGRHPKPPEPEPVPEPESEPETLPEAVAIEETAPAPPRTRIRIRDLKSVSPVGWLGGHSAEDPTVTPEHFTAAVLAAATAGGNLPHIPGDIRRLPDGSWVCRFASSVVPAVAALKMGILHDRWGVEVRQPDPDRLVLRRDAPANPVGRLFGAFSKKKTASAGGGLEVTIALAQLSRGVGEVTVGGRITGAPDAEFVRSAEDSIPKMIEDVWRELGNVADPRKHPRVAAEFPLTVHPLHSDGTLDPSLDGRCRDVSAGGLSFATTDPVTTRYVFVEFGGVKGLGGLAILAKLVRSQTQQVGDEYFYGAQYRTDL